MLCRLTPISRRFPYYKTKHNPRRCSYQPTTPATNLHFSARQFSSGGSDEPPSGDKKKGEIKFSEALQATAKSQGQGACPSTCERIQNRLLTFRHKRRTHDDSRHLRIHPSHCRTHICTSPNPRAGQTNLPECTERIADAQLHHQRCSVLASRQSRNSTRSCDPRSPATLHCIAPPRAPLHSFLRRRLYLLSTEEPLGCSFSGTHPLSLVCALAGMVRPNAQLATPTPSPTQTLRRLNTPTNPRILPCEGREAEPALIPNRGVRPSRKSRLDQCPRRPGRNGSSRVPCRPTDVQGYPWGVGHPRSRCRSREQLARNSQRIGPRRRYRHSQLFAYPEEESRGSVGVPDVHL